MTTDRIDQLVDSIKKVFQFDKVTRPFLFNFWCLKSLKDAIFYEESNQQKDWKITEQCC